MKGIVITGTLYRKADGKVMAVGEWEALDLFAKQFKKINPMMKTRNELKVKV